MNSNAQATKWWSQRYGAEEHAVEPEIAGFLGHRSVRKFSDKEVSRDVIEQLIAASQSASTSSNLQFFSIVSVQEPARRERITDLCSKQDQVKNAPWFFAFCADHYRLSSAAELSGLDASGLDLLESFLVACVDVSLAAERFVCAAESLGLGTCYIGALRNDPAGVAECLNLPKGVFGIFGLCVGYPDESLNDNVKPRLSQPKIWFEESYDQAVNTEEYDSRMAEFYERTGQDPSLSWLEKSARRLTLEYMGGREKLLPYLQEQGFLRR